MSVLTCDDVRDAAPEYALNILPPDERAAVAAHVSTCPACQEEVSALGAVGARLLELVPGTEPPLGFDHQVLARAPDLEGDRHAARRAARPREVARRSRRAFHRHPRLLAAVATAAAAAALVFGILGWMAGGGSHHRHGQVLFSAPIRQGIRNVGEVLAYHSYDGPTWVNMMVHGASGARQVTCELLYTDGHVQGLGTFDLVRGSGTWGAPDWSSLTGVSGARLLGPNGQVLATATFSSGSSW